jgi:cellulose biosynthesis protein BcsQ
MRQAAATRANGVIATFYSYKGGTGRSMALANTGCLLGKSLPSNGRVLLIDWDLEARGLYRYFPICDLPENTGRPGVIDYFSELRDKLTPELYAEICQPEGWQALENAIPLDPYLALNVSAGVDLMKAGLGGPGYADRVASFDWADFYRRYHLVYAAFREMLARRYHWTLIDSRTGLTDASGVCTMLMPEKLVAVFTPNRQSVEGLIDLIHKAVEYRRKSEDTRPLAVFALPSRIVTEEHKLLQEAQASYRSEFEACFRKAYGLELSENFLGPYFDEVAIPHKGFYGFREQVAVRDDEQTADALSINRAYERFFRRFSLLTRSWDTLPAQTGGGRRASRGIQIRCLHQLCAH